MNRPILYPSLSLTASHHEYFFHSTTSILFVSLNVVLNIHFAFERSGCRFSTRISTTLAQILRHFLNTTRKILELCLKIEHNHDIFQFIVANYSTLRNYTTKVVDKASLSEERINHSGSMYSALFVLSVLSWLTSLAARSCHAILQLVGMTKWLHNFNRWRETKILQLKLFVLCKKKKRWLGLRAMPCNS
jgi:hypothetical protein